MLLSLYSLLLRAVFSAAANARGRTSNLALRAHGWSARKPVIGLHASAFLSVLLRSNEPIAINAGVVAQAARGKKRVSPGKSCLG
jgi:hypothetical protein